MVASEKKCNLTASVAFDQAKNRDQVQNNLILQSTSHIICACIVGPLHVPENGLSLYSNTLRQVRQPIETRCICIPPTSHKPTVVRGLNLRSWGRTYCVNGPRLRIIVCVSVRNIIYYTGRLRYNNIHLLASRHRRIKGYRFARVCVGRVCILLSMCASVLTRVRRISFTTFSFI